MGRQPAVEELLSIIILQRKALEFYENKENYVQNTQYNDELCSMIEIDDGHQARFALKQSENALNFHEKMVIDIKNYEVFLNSDTTKNSSKTDLIDEFKRKVEEIKKYDENI